MSGYQNEENPPIGVPAAHAPVLGRDSRDADREMALVALSHTAAEHRLYVEMLRSLAEEAVLVGDFDLRRLSALGGPVSASSVRRASSGLVRKLSIEPARSRHGSRVPRYRVYEAWEILERRRAAGVEPFPSALEEFQHSRVFDLVGPRVVTRVDLSRREILATLCCVEGLSNAAIGRRLNISEKTVKYHLRHVFGKLGVKRRAELLGFLLREKEANRYDCPTPRAAAARPGNV